MMGQLSDFTRQVRAHSAECLCIVDLMSFVLSQP